MIVTEKHLKAAASPRGGYSKKQIALAKTLYKKKWKKNLLGKNVSDEFWKQFYSLRGSGIQPVSKNKKKIINAVSRMGDWSWQPKEEDIPKAKFSKSNKNQGKRKVKRQRINRQDDDQFYLSREWRELRVRVLEKYECKCMMCGRSPKIHGIVIHVDHIKPRSKYPELSLVFENLQILCDDCNLGKSNRYETDWRPGDDSELEILAEARERI